MTYARTLASGLILSAALVTGAAHAQYNQQGPGYQQGGWDAPPSEYSDDLHRHAFHDGIEAARHDFQAQQPPDPMRHEEFRHPQVPEPAREEYRNAYKRGYFMATQHLRGGVPQGAPPPPQQAYGQGGWDTPPSEFSDDLRRHAFHDGIEAARRDFQNHIQPDPAQHEEFRHPQVPYPARDTYREAYKRGYFMAVEHMRQGR